MAKQLSIQNQLTIPEVRLNDIETIIEQCKPVATSVNQTFRDSLIIANGLLQMKEFFNDSDVKKLVEAMRDSHLGFLTDRNEYAIWKAKKNGKDLKPYTYNQIIEALIPCMLKGYKLTGNEINIISGKGIPVKEGKYNRIIDLTEGFREVIGVPIIEKQTAIIRCKAKWRTKDGNEQTLGHDDDDPCNVKVPYNQYDSFDKVIGLAQSKLYSKVLTRITGGFVPDGEVDIDLVDGQVITSETLFSDKTMPTNLKNAKSQKSKQSSQSNDNVIELEKTYRNPDNLGIIQNMFEDAKIDSGQIEEIIKKKDQQAARWCLNIINQYNSKEINKNDDSN